jgi:hypothetical protein
MQHFPHRVQTKVAMMLRGDSPGAVIKVQEGGRVPGDDPAPLCFPCQIFSPTPASTGIQLISSSGRRTGFAGCPRYGMRIPGSSPFLAGVRERFRDAGRNLVVITVS